MDHFSPVAPAHIRVLVLPVGQIERARFLLFVQRLQREVSILPLAEVEQQSDSDTFLLSPKAFPQGSLLYRFSPAASSEQQQQLSPFELFREPLLVLGVVDGLHSTEESSEKELEYAAAYLKERHPRVVHRQLVVWEDSDHGAVSETSSAIGVSNIDRTDDPSLRAAVCELSARFLLELTTYAKAMHALPTIQTPGHTARSLQRTTSLRGSEKRPSSGRSTPSNSVSSPTDEGSPQRLPSRAPPAPATSFDQIPSANSMPSTAPRPDSRASNQSNKGKSSGRASSHDRVSVQGFGSSTSQEKARVRGKARVGITLAAIYMMSGLWSEALRMLVEHTSKARTLADHLWHAKGLENMVVCMLLLTWAGAEFQVPSLCDPVSERTPSLSAQRNQAEAKLAAETSKRQYQIIRLSNAIPDLAKLVLNLYRSTEGALELPFLIPAEATVRMSKLLAALCAARGELRPAILQPLIFNPYAPHGAEASPPTTSKPTTTKPPSRILVADMLAQAVPGNEDGLATGDHIRILAGIASSYAMLGLDRKKAITVKELVVRLTGALIQARKLGAAEMGIHPAASLSTDTGADTILAIAEESGGINDLMGDLSRIYGAGLEPPSHTETPSYLDTKAFGHPGLKFSLLRELANFCEAHPDPYGVLLSTASLLRAAGPNAAIDAAPSAAENAFSREEQMHLATVVSRTVAVSKHLGLSDVQATYWDPFLVRGVEILQPTGPKVVIDRTKLNKADTGIGQVGPGNPLLYDPNASRPGTATVKQTFLLVQSEASECIITLQNPFDIPVDIEDLQLMTDGIELSSRHEPVTLGPLRFQQVTLMVSAKAVGATKITGCKVKMQGCSPQVFPIVPTAWSAKSPLTLKNSGLGARPANLGKDDKHDLKKLGVEPEAESATVIDALPTLALEETSLLESGLMLLEGESRSLSLVLRNTGTIPACVFEVADTGDVLRLAGHATPEASTSSLLETVVEPGASATFSFEAEGKAGVSSTQANFFYCANGARDVKYARVVSVPLDMTISAALQVHNLDVMQAENGEEDGLLVSFDIRNAWLKSIFYECLGGVADAGSRQLPEELAVHRGQLAPAEIRRICQTMPQSIDDIGFEEDVDVVRARFLNRLHIRWKVDERSGIVAIHGLTLSSEALELVRGPPVHLSAGVAELRNGTKPDVTVGGFVCVRIDLVNRAERSSGPLFVKLAPRSSSDSACDEKGIAVAGTMQRILPPLAERKECVVEFVVCPLLAGVLELEALVRSAQIGQLKVGGDWQCRRLLRMTVRAG